jgi:preprotein translocase subunit SecG
MNNVLLVIHLLVALAMIGVVLLQRSEGGALGMGGGGGGGGGMGGFLTGRGTANLLTRATAILAAAFFVTSLTLSILADGGSEPTSILDDLPVTAPSQDQEPAGPSVPVE